MKQKIVLVKDGNAILKALEEIRNEIADGKLKFEWQKEDIHSLIEERLVEKVGERGSIYLGSLLNYNTAADNSKVNRSDYYLGGEYNIKPTLALGALISKTNGKIDADLGYDDIKGSFGQLYVRQQLGEAFELSASFGASQHDNDLRRVTLNGMVTGTSDTSSYTSALGLAYKDGWHFAQAAITPSLDLYYSSSKMNGFTETGSVDALQNFGTTANEFIARLGATAVWTTSVNGRPFSFELKPGVEQILSSDAGSINLQMNNSPAIRYGIEYLEKDKTTGTIGVGMGYAIFDKASINVSYEGQVNNQVGHQFNANFKMSF